MMKVEIMKLIAKLYERLTNEELNSFLSRAVGQLNPELTQDLMSVVTELIDYRDKIENGTLVELPCKVGDTIYYIRFCGGNFHIYENKVLEICITDKWVGITAINGEWHWANSVFFFREEAEKKVKKLKGEE